MGSLRSPEIQKQQLAQKCAKQKHHEFREGQQLKSIRMVIRVSRKRERETTILATSRNIPIPFFVLLLLVSYNNTKICGKTNKKLIMCQMKQNSAMISSLDRQQRFVFLLTCWSTNSRRQLKVRKPVWRIIIRIMTFDTGVGNNHFILTAAAAHTKKNNAGEYVPHIILFSFLRLCGYKLQTQTLSFGCCSVDRNW